MRHAILPLITGYSFLILDHMKITYSKSVPGTDSGDETLGNSRVYYVATSDLALAFEAAEDAVREIARLEQRFVAREDMVRVSAHETIEELRENLATAKTAVQRFHACNHEVRIILLRRVASASANLNQACERSRTRFPKERNSDRYGHPYETKGAPS